MLKKIQSQSHQDLFQPPRAYQGEPPTVAGFLLYPDAPTKMKTTSQEAFSFRPQVKGNKAYDDPRSECPTQKSQQESVYSSLSSSRRTGRGNSSRDTKDEQESSVYRPVQIEMKSLYQRDFPPPSHCRRRTPAAPQLDNIGINPAFRLEFSTVQREAYQPFWQKDGAMSINGKKV